RYSVRLDDGSQLAADAVILAVPAYVAADLVEPLSTEAAVALDGIDYVSVAVVALLYPAAAFPQPPQGSGFLVPRSEGRAITACTWVSSKWPHAVPPGRVLARCYVGRAGDDRWLWRPDADLLAAVRRDLADIAGVGEAPAWSRVFRWRRAMPQYAVGHLQRLAAVREALAPHPGIVLAGAGYHGLGLPDCIRQGMEAAAAALAAAAPPPPARPARAAGGAGRPRRGGPPRPRRRSGRRERRRGRAETF
ncbi:MAG: protoporphyrinogen oxidase, partial [Clostridia bacterium]|nr:protoporphyrinogen oxidase [Clostridia bacterium]